MGYRGMGTGGEGGAERKGECITLPRPSRFEELYPANITILVPAQALRMQIYA